MTTRADTTTRIGEALSPPVKGGLSVKSGLVPGIGKGLFLRSNVDRLSMSAKPKQEETMDTRTFWHDTYGRIALLGDVASVVWIGKDGVWFGQFRTIPYGAVVNLPLSEVRESE